MDFLETRIPPLLLAFIFGFLMWLIPDINNLHGYFNDYALPVSLVITLSGIWICVAGIIGFRNARTTVNPTTPEQSSSLVTEGVYQISRNPMYVGFLLCIIAWGIFQDNLLALIFGLLFVPYMNRFQIKVEERFLEKLFGEQFTEYCQKVRRWL